MLIGKMGSLSLRTSHKLRDKRRVTQVESPENRLSALTDYSAGV